MADNPPQGLSVTAVRDLLRMQQPTFAAASIAPIEPPGWHNWVFHIKGPDGGHLGRFPKSADDAAMLRLELAYLPQLKPHLPLPIPTPVATGTPTATYPYPWALYEWIPGATLQWNRVAQPLTFAHDLAGFLIALREAPLYDVPASRYRGGSLQLFDAQVQQAITRLADQYDAALVLRTWLAACAAPITQAPVWLHGDIAPGNLLLNDVGRLAAVIDFGVMGSGDPACDYAIAWKCFDAPARAAFRQALDVDTAMWHRARGWALWKGLIIEAGLAESDVQETAAAGYAIRECLADFARYEQAG